MPVLKIREHQSLLPRCSFKLRGYFSPSHVVTVWPLLCDDKANWILHSDNLNWPVIRAAYQRSDYACWHTVSTMYTDACRTAQTEGWSHHITAVSHSVAVSKVCLSFHLNCCELIEILNRSASFEAQLKSLAMLHRRIWLMKMHICVSCIYMIANVHYNRSSIVGTLYLERKCTCEDCSITIWVQIFTACTLNRTTDSVSSSLSSLMQRLCGE